MIQPKTKLKVADNTGASSVWTPSKPSVLNNFQHGETPSFPDPLCGSRVEEKIRIEQIGEV